MNWIDCAEECFPSIFIFSLYTEARILIALDPLPDSEKGKRLNFIIPIIQEFENTVISIRGHDDQV